jgi:hypothetical protein
MGRQRARVVLLLRGALCTCAAVFRSQLYARVTHVTPLCAVSMYLAYTYLAGP